MDGEADGDSARRSSDLRVASLIDLGLAAACITAIVAALYFMG